jgi:CBS domain-containing protein
MSKVRDAMIAEPPALEASASTQEAGELFDRPEVRAVLVCEEGRLTGIVTRKTLVREVVARGRDPRGTLLGEIAEDPMFTLAPDAELDDAFRELEERDLDRAPVVESDGRLVGVLSRAVVQRRLAEDEPPVEQEA